MRKVGGRYVYNVPDSPILPTWRSARSSTSLSFTLTYVLSLSKAVHNSVFTMSALLDSKQNHYPSEDVAYGNEKEKPGLVSADEHDHDRRGSIRILEDLISEGKSMNLF